MEAELGYELRKIVVNYTHFWGMEDDERPSRFEGGLALTNGLLDVSNVTQSPLGGSSRILIGVCEIVSYDPNLVAVTSEKGGNFLIFHAPVDAPLADLETVHMNDRESGSRILRADIVGGIPSAVNMGLAHGQFAVKKKY